MEGSTKANGNVATVDCDQKCAHITYLQKVFYTSVQGNINNNNSMWFRFIYTVCTH